MLRTAALALPLAMVAGTGAGFALKYVSDKFWIVQNPWRRSRPRASPDLLYGVFSVGTTMLFWVMEGLFTMVFHTRLEEKKTA